MIVLKIKCKCGKLLRVPETLAGKKVGCPACKRGYRLSHEKFGLRAPELAAAGAKSNAKTTPARPPPAQPVAPSDLELSSIDPLITPSELNLLDEIGPSSGIIMPEMGGAVAPAVTPTDVKTCPSCQKVWPKNAKICVQCGVDLKTGRSILMTDDSRLDDAYVRAENSLRVVSWLIPLGLYPIASEAFGTRRPYLVHSIAIITILTSVAFWLFNFTGPDHRRTSKNLLLWCGNAQPHAEFLPLQYAYSGWGDNDAYEAKIRELSQQRPSPRSDTAAPQNIASDLRELSTNKKQGDDAQDDNEESTIEESDETVQLAAHKALPPEQQCFGQFHWWQLLSNAFLHSGIMHLAGNLLFLIVLGSRVNSLIGSIYSAIAYPVLAILASLAYMMSARADSPHPALGASGAIMGLAGMYLVFFPVHKVHMAAWVRRGLMGGFQLNLKLFAVRGFWVVLFYISFDILYTVLGLKDHVAHWAHLGGFIAGVGLALLMLVTRLVNARGGDLLTAVFGRRAWALIGKPR